MKYTQTFLYKNDYLFHNSIIEMKTPVNIFIFRRDLRVEDNTALFQLTKDTQNGETILPIFIFNTHQIDPQINSYYSNNCVQFMVESLEALNKFLPLQYFETVDDIDVLNELQKTLIIHKIYFNIDFTPYAIKRDERIIEWCRKNNILCKTFDDYTLLPVNTVLNNSGSYYSVFTPFYKKFISMNNKIERTTTISKDTLNKIAYKGKYIGNTKGTQIKKYFGKPNVHILVHGGRDNALKLVDRIKNKQLFTYYDKNRDYPSIDGTTKLSPYLKFGCVSVREVYETVKETYDVHHGLIRELIWRDFYANITFNKPRILGGQINKKTGNLSFKDKYDDIEWEVNEHFFEKWCKGETGFPMVDAAMRQLNTTGWMHNRCRMIVACFLIKDLLIDWRKGEQYFATKLIDYDPSSNNGGWQFCSSTGVDAQPYFRIFNPFTQSQKFDVETKYIKKWIPELEDVPPKDIHAWNVSYKKYIDTCEYPQPIVEHSVQSKKAVQMYKKALS